MSPAFAFYICRFEEPGTERPYRIKVTSERPEAAPVVYGFEGEKERAEALARLEARFIVAHEHLPPRRWPTREDIEGPKDES